MHWEDSITPRSLSGMHGLTPTPRKLQTIPNWHSSDSSWLVLQKCQGHEIQGNTEELFQLTGGLGHTSDVSGRSCLDPESWQDPLETAGDLNGVCKLATGSGLMMVLWLCGTMLLFLGNTCCIYAQILPRKHLIFIYTHRFLCA